MLYTDEKDYIMRMIKEMVRVLFSVALGKKYVSVEQERENKYAVAGNPLENLLRMADQGKINEAENILLENLDYGNREEVAAAALFYQYVGEKDTEFLEKNHYSDEEVIFGMKQLLENSGLGQLVDLPE